MASDEPGVTPTWVHWQLPPRPLRPRKSLPSSGGFPSAWPPCRPEEEAPFFKAPTSPAAGMKNDCSDPCPSSPGRAQDEEE
jgi:hypothetical protein